MANIQVSGYEGDNNWALLLDTDNFIAEGTGDNFFIVKNNTLYTPEPRNILRGISREYVFSLANELGLDYKECNLDVYDVINADEAFMTGTPFCILPVTSLNGQPIVNHGNTSIVKALISKWSENVGVDIVKQIKTWNEKSKMKKDGAPTPYSFKSKS